MSRRNIAAAVIVLLILIAAGVYVWYMTGRLAEIERNITAAERRSATVSRQMEEYSRQLQRAIADARAATQRADQAEYQAAESAAARVQAESVSERLRGETEHALTQAEQARLQARQANAEIEELRKRRTEELNRMQEALNRIAPTRRTPLGMVVELAEDSFKFDFDKAALTQDNKELLSRIAGVLLASQGYRLFVYGHTDDIGPEDYNEGLSRRRADSVADYLVDAGIPADIITRKGYGKTSPRVPGQTRDARQKNRRVEIGIVDTIIDYHGSSPQP